MTTRATDEVALQVGRIAIETAGLEIAAVVMCEEAFGWSLAEAEEVARSTPAILRALDRLPDHVDPDIRPRVAAWAVELHRLVDERGRWAHAAVVTESLMDEGRGQALALIHARTGERPYRASEAEQLLRELRRALLESNWILWRLMGLADSLRTEGAE